jgi:hypothetical protein
MKFSVRQLQNMAKNCGVRVVLLEQFHDDDTEKLIREDYIVCIREQLTFEQVVNYAKKRKLDLSDIILPETQTTSNSSDVPKYSPPSIDELQPNKEKMYEILQYIEDEFIDETKFRDEEEFEKHLHTLLRPHLKKEGLEVYRQYKSGRHTFDLFIQGPDFEMVIEVKLGKSIEVVRSAHGQIRDYMTTCPNAAIIVMHTGKKQMIPYYDEFKTNLEKDGIEFLVVDGKLKKKPSRRKQKNIHITID